MNDGDTHNGPSEQVEAKYPLLVERYALRPDSGGAGRFRGGLGSRAGGAGAHTISLQLADGPREMQALGSRSAACPAFGNAVAIHRFGEAQEQRFHNGKALNQVLHAGDAYILRSGGGGGFGSPLDRDLDSLARDVRCGYVSKDAAEKILRRGVRAGHEQDRSGGDQDQARRDAPAGAAARRADRRYRGAAARDLPRARA